MKTAFTLTGITNFTIQLTGWVFFIGVPLYTHPHAFLQHPGRLTDFILRHLVLIAFFYINYFYLIPVVLKRSRLRKYFVAVVVLFALTFIVQNVIEYSIMPMQDERISFKSFIALIQLYAISTSLRMLTDFIHETRRKKMLEHEKMTVELAFLRSQINPHFLFNTLNNINSLIHINPDAAQKAIVRLSTIMRYMLNTATKEKITLEKELEYIGNYIELQRLRVPAGFSLTYTCMADNTGALIEPLLLIGFIENAFKHARSDNPTDFIQIKIELHNGKLLLETANPAHRSKKT